MLTTKMVIDSIKDGVSMPEVMEYVYCWIGEARRLADTLDEVFFNNGIPEGDAEALHAFFGRLTANFHTLEMTLDWIQKAVEETESFLFLKEREEAHKIDKNEGSAEE